VRSCIYGGMTISGREVSVEEVIDEVVQDIVFFKNSGGGVTLTGGEVLQQPAFALGLLKELKAYGIHTIVETSGMGQWEDLKSMYPLVDLFYFDLKIMNARNHLDFTGQQNHLIIENLKRLRAVTDRIVIRIPLIPQYTDGWENVEAIYKFAAVYGIVQLQLLPYNSNASAKYEWLGRSYMPGNLMSQDRDYLESLKSRAPEGLLVKIID
jgi:pyruvate formate lyase activating enzyme